MKVSWRRIQLFEGTDDGAFVVTEDSEIRWWNAGARKVFGYAPEEVWAKPLRSTGALGTPVCVGHLSIQHCAINHIERAAAARPSTAVPRTRSCHSYLPGDVKQTIDIPQTVLATEIVCVLRYTQNAIAQPAFQVSA